MDYINRMYQISYQKIIRLMHQKGQKINTLTLEKLKNKYIFNNMCIIISINSNVHISKYILKYRLAMLVFLLLIVTNFHNHSGLNHTNLLFYISICQKSNIGFLMINTRLSSGLHSHWRFQRSLFPCFSHLVEAAHIPYSTDPFLHLESQQHRISQIILL